MSSSSTDAPGGSERAVLFVNNHIYPVGPSEILDRFFEAVGSEAPVLASLHDRELSGTEAGAALRELADVSGKVDSLGLRTEDGRDLGGLMKRVLSYAADVDEPASVIRAS